MNTFNPTRVLSFDLETTSADPREARIVTSSLLLIDGSQVKTRELLADPGVEIPAAATEIHGISTAYAREHGRPHDEVLAETIAIIEKAWQQDYSLVVYNAPYDLTVLRALRPEFTVRGIVFDPYLIDRMKDPYRKGRRTLGAVAEAYGVQLENAHNSSADALAAARIAWKQAKKWPDLNELHGDDLVALQAEGFAAAQDSLEEYLRRQKNDPQLRVNRSWPVARLD